MFRLFVCVVAFALMAVFATDVEAQVFRRRNDDGVNVRAARGANVVVNQSFGGGGAAQSAAIGGGGGRVAGANVGFGNRGFAVRGHHHGGGAAAFFVPTRIQAFPVYVQPQFQVQSFAVPLNTCPVGVQAFSGFGASAFAY